MLSADLYKRSAFSWYQFLWRSADWVFPPTCGGCGRNGFVWCPDCDRLVLPIEGPVCQQCGIPTLQGRYCKNCIAEPPSFTALRSYTEYKEPMRSAIIKMKHYPDYGLGLSLSTLMSSLFHSLSWKIDLVTSLPLSEKRFRERGFNQSDLIAFPLSLSIGARFKTGIVRRVRETRRQVGLSAIERKSNVSGAFTADPKLVNNKNILVLDDVATTGSSLSSCAAALKEAGAGDIFGFTLARPILKNTLPIPEDV